MKRRYLLSATVAVLYLLTLAKAPGETYRIESARSKIGFKVHQFVTTVTGKFTRFGSVLEFDREHPEKSSVSATIQVRSVDTGIRKRDEHLCSAEFFDAAKFPEITFKSRSVKQTAPDSGDIVGDFTMHGVTKPVTLHVKSLTKIDRQAETTRWQVTTEPLSRSEFALRWPKTLESVSMIGDAVAVNIEIVATAAR